MSLKGCFSVVITVVGVFSVIAASVAVVNGDWGVALLLVALGIAAVVAAVKL